MTTMQIDRAVVEQALETIEGLTRDRLFTAEWAGKHGATITALRAALAQRDEPVAYTTGHCENHKQKGGCQLHNLQCGWPDCDRKPTTASSQQAEPAQAQRCRAEPRSDGDFVCDCKMIGGCPGRSAALAQQAEPAGTRALIEECLAAFAEELAGWDIDPPLHHVKQAHDKCEAWLAALAQQAKAETCTWQQDGDSESSVYATSCRRYFSLDDGTPEDNKMAWCCFCGKKLVQEMITEEDGND